MAEYVASKENKKLDILDLLRLEPLAETVLEKGAWGYIHSGAESEWTMRQNTAAFDGLQIVPRVLSGVEKPDTRTQILGIDLSMPIILTPAAAHGLAREDAEVASVKGVAEAGTLMGIGTYANRTLAEIAKAAGGAPLWFQLYFNKDEGFNRFLLEQAVACGMKAIVLTADTTVAGHREIDDINHFVYPVKMANVEQFNTGKGQGIGELIGGTQQKLTPDIVGWIAERTKLPVLVKGIQSPEDAMLAIGAGASGVWVSNHGGRQLDGAPAAIDSLIRVARAVEKKVPIVFDSGIRRGQHVFKAIASGADVVAIGRPVFYGLTLGGAQGVASIFRHLQKELVTVMQLAGTQNVERIKHTHLIKKIYEAV